MAAKIIIRFGCKLIEMMQEKGIVDLKTLDALKAQWIDASGHRMAIL